MAAKIDSLREELDAASAEAEELLEEESQDEGLLTEVLNEKGKVTKAAIKERKRDLDPNESPEDAEELAMIGRYEALADREANLKKTVKERAEELHRAVVERYGTLTEGDVRTILVERGWLAPVKAAVEDETRSAVRTLTTRVEQLEARYRETIPQLIQKCDELQAKVDEHLASFFRQVYGSLSLNRLEYQLGGSGLPFEKSALSVRAAASRSQTWRQPEHRV